MPPGTTAIEKRTIASFVPTWNSSNCTQVRRKVTAKADQTPCSHQTLWIDTSLAWLRFRLSVNPVYLTAQPPSPARLLSAVQHLCIRVPTRCHPSRAGHA